MLYDLIREFGSARPKEFATKEGCKVKLSGINGNYTVVDVDVKMKFPSDSKKPDLIVAFMHNHVEHLAILEMKSNLSDIESARKQVQAGSDQIQKNFTPHHDLRFLPAVLFNTRRKRPKDRRNHQIIFNNQRYGLIVKRHQVDVTQLKPKKED